MKKLLIHFAILFSCLISAQEKDKVLPKANAAFLEKKYADAEADYRISQSKSASKTIASYNLGNSIYRQNQVSEAKGAYKKAIQSAKTYQHKHKAFHNLGNAYMTEKKYAQAVEAYKNALRNNPDDEETRYNYALARKYLKENPPKDDKKDDKKDKKKDDKKDKDKKKDEPEDKGKKDQKKDEGDKEENKDGKPKDQKQPKPEEGGISKQRLQSILDAVNNEERKIKEKLNAKKVKSSSSKPEKDW